MKKKLLSIILTLCMVMTMVPTAAFATEGETVAQEAGNVAKIGTTEYATVQAAVDAAPDGVETTITMIADSQETVTIPKGKNIVLDLGGKTLSQTGDVNTLANDGTLVLKNGTITGDNSGDGSYVVYNNWGTMTVEGVTVNGARGALYSNHVGSKLTVVSGTFTATEYHALYNRYGIVEIKGGSFTGGSGCGVYAESSGNVSESVGNDEFSGSVSTTVTGGDFGGDISRQANVAVPMDRKVEQVNGRWQVLEKNALVAVVYFGEETTYETLEAALNAAEDAGSTLKLLGNVSLNADLTINKGITLDLNGFTLAGTKLTFTSSGAITDTSKAQTGVVTVPIDVDGFFNFEGGTYRGAISQTGDGKLNLEKGTFEASVTGTVSTYYGRDCKFATSAGYGVDNLPVDVTASHFNGYQPVVEGDYVVFKPITYTIKLVLDGGLITDSSLSAEWTYTYDGNKVTIPKNTQIERQTDVFEGWYYNQECTGLSAAGSTSGNVSAYNVATKSVNNVLTLYAKWSEAAASVTAADGSVAYYKTLSSAISGAKDGQTVALLTDVTISAQTSITKSITLDLGTHTLTDATGAWGLVISSGTVTIQNGTIGSTSYAAVYVAAAANVTLDNVTIDTTTSSSTSGVSVAGQVAVNANTIIKSKYAGINVYEGTPVVDVYGTVEVSEEYAAIQGNGTNTTKPGSTINIYDGAVIKAASGAAIYNPQFGTVNVFGGTIQGGTGIGIKSGTLNITTGAIKATGEYVENPTSVGNGIANEGSAIIVDSNIGYEGAMNIAISGDAILESTNGHVIREIGNDAGVTNVVTLNVTGGRFNGNSAIENIRVREVTAPTVSISGGYFTSDVSDHAAENYTAQAGSYTGGYTYKVVPVANNKIESATAVVKTSEDVEVEGESVTVAVGANNLTVNGLMSTANKAVITYTMTDGKTGTITVTYGGDPAAFTADPASVTVGHTTYQVNVAVEVIPANLGIEAAPPAKGAAPEGLPAEEQTKATAADELLSSATPGTTLKAEGLGEAASTVTKPGTETGVAITVDTPTPNAPVKITDDMLTAAAAEDKLNVNTETEELKIIVKPSLEIAVKNAAIEGTGIQTYTYDIKPKVTIEVIKVEKGTDNKVGNEVETLVSNADMKVTTPIDVTIPVPAGILGGNVMIRHEVGDRPYYRVVKDTTNNTITFTTSSFSNFTAVGDSATGTVNFGEDGTKTYDMSNLNEALPPYSGVVPAGQQFKGWRIEDTVYTAVTTELLDAINGKTGARAALAEAVIEPIPVIPSVTTYAITVADAGNGAVTASRKNASRGTTVTLTAKADEGYALADLTVTDKNGNEIELTEKDGKYTFKMPGSKVTVTAAFAPVFDDVFESDYYYKEVLYAYSTGLMVGFDGSFGPNGSFDRKQLAMLLWNMEGNPVVETELTFTDVPADAWYSDAVRWAASTGAMIGYGGDLFGPDDLLTRQQLATAFYRYAEAEAEAGDLSGFTDAADVDSWAADGVIWAVNHDLIQGWNGSLTPDATAIRAQVAVMLARYLKNLA